MSHRQNHEQFMSRGLKCIENYEEMIEVHNWIEEHFVQI